MKVFIWILCLLIPLLAFAEIYQITDAKGDVYYTDQPSDNAKPVQLDPTVTVVDPAPSASSPKNKNDNKIEVEGAPINYTEFSISDPQDQGTIWNQPNIPVLVSINPALAKGDKIAVFLDGKEVPPGPSASTQFSLAHPDRGQHTLQAKLYGPKGEVKKTSALITVFIHYTAAGAMLRRIYAHK